MADYLQFERKMIDPLLQMGLSFFRERNIDVVYIIDTNIDVYTWMLDEKQYSYNYIFTIRGRYSPFLDMKVHIIQDDLHKFIFELYILGYVQNIDMNLYSDYIRKHEGINYEIRE